MGLTSDAFWGLTIAQLCALLKQRKIDSYMRRYDVAALRATLLNFFGKKKWKVEELIGPSPVKAPIKKQSQQDIMNQLLLIFPREESVK